MHSKRQLPACLSAGQIAPPAAQLCSEQIQVELQHQHSTEGDFSDAFTDERVMRQ